MFINKNQLYNLLQNKASVIVNGQIEVIKIYFEFDDPNPICIYLQLKEKQYCLTNQYTKVYKYKNTLIVDYFKFRNCYKTTFILNLNF